MTAVPSKEMEKLSIGGKVGPQAVYAAKKKPGSLGQEMQFLTNLTKLEVTRNLVYYKYDVEMALYFKMPSGSGDINEDKPKLFTKGPKNDSDTLKRKEQCMRVMGEVMKRHAAVMGLKQGNTLLYDRQAVMFSLNELQLPVGGGVFKLEPSLLTAKPDAAEIRVRISKVTENFQVSSNDVTKAVNCRPDMADKGILEVYNLLISQKPCHDPNWVTYGQCNHFMLKAPSSFSSDDLKPLEDGMRMHVGVSKSVKVLEGTNKNAPSVFAVTELKKTAIHEGGGLLVDKVLSMVNRGPPQQGRQPDLRPGSYEQKLVGEKIKDLTVAPNYLKDAKTEPKTFTIGRVNGPAANSAETAFEGGNGVKYKSIADYFARKYNLRLRYPDFFTVSPKSPLKGGQRPWFPLELLTVCDKQRVKKEQESERNQAVMVRCSAALPEKRLAQTAALKNEIGLVQGNKDLLNVGLKPDNNFTTVKGRVLPAPVVGYLNNSNVITQNGRWRIDRNKFVVPKALPKWKWHILYSGNPRMDDRVIDDYYDRLKQEMNARGVKYSEADVSYHGRSNSATLKTIFREAADQGIRFLFFISEDSVKLHDELKLLEQQTQILTQEVRYSKVRDTIMKNQRDTLTNVVMKINAKCGGSNHMLLFNNLKGQTSLPIESPSCLIIGFEMSATASETPCLGFGANHGAVTQYFKGDYRYTDYKNLEMLRITIREVIGTVVSEAKETRKKPIDQLIVYFNGPSEGTFKDLITQIVPILEQAIAPSKKVCVLVASKSHNERIFMTRISGPNATAQNIPSGTVVDQHIVSPALSEFYIASHLAFQGTAKTVKYSVIHDGCNLELDALQGLTHALSFGHGIVNLATSLPVPLLVADRMAKRGRNNNVVISGNSTEGGQVDFERLNSQLTYKGKPLRTIRFNA